MTWEELGKRLQLSRIMLHYVRKGERDLSVKALHRLLNEEKDAGLVPAPTDKSESPTPKNWGGPYWGTSTAAPVIAFARGGAGGYPEDMGSDVPHIPVTCKDPNCYVLELEGDSMEPIYSPGDFLVCAPNLQVQPGDLVVARTVDDEVLFKQYRQRGKTILLQSFNPKHPTIEMHPKDMRKMHLVQSVVRVLKGKPF